MNQTIRVFIFAAVATLAILLAIGFSLGVSALATALLLAIIELTFSFDNAIVNAKVLEQLSPRWQTAFLTVGIIIAIFLVRLVLPIVIVALGASLNFSDVLSLATHNPHEYAHHLELAHPLIASFGGAFLLVLALEFFINGKHATVWVGKLENRLKSFASYWLPSAVTLIIIFLLAIFLGDGSLIYAGGLGVLTYLVLQLIIALFSRGKTAGHRQLFGWAGLGLFLYLQALDASFSLDSVIGAFAITSEVLLIAAGLGIGALWVRSLTIFMVRSGTLAEYKYLEHGAYYTIFVLAISFLLSLFLAIPDYVTGLISLTIIGLAVFSSVRARKLAV